MEYCINLKKMSRAILTHLVLFYYKLHCGLHFNYVAGPCGQGEGGKNVIFCGCHKWMAPHGIMQSSSARKNSCCEVVF